MFYDKSRSARIERFGHIGAISVHGEKDYMRFRSFAQEHANSVNAVDERHSDISHDDIGTKDASRLQQRFAIVHNRHDFAFRFEQVAQPLGNDGMIVNQQHLWLSVRPHTGFEPSGLGTANRVDLHSNVQSWEVWNSN